MTGHVVSRPMRVGVTLLLLSASGRSAPVKRGSTFSLPSRLRSSLGSMATPSTGTLKALISSGSRLTVRDEGPCTCSRAIFVVPYVQDLKNVVDMDAIRCAGLEIGVDPLGGAARPYWEPINVVRAGPAGRLVLFRRRGERRGKLSAATTVAAYRDRTRRCDEGLERRLWFRSGLEQLLVSDAIRRPGNGVESLRLDRSTIHQALPVRSVLDSSQRSLHLLQSGRVKFCFDEVFAFRLVGHARVSDVGGGVDQLVASRADIPSEVLRKARFEADQSLPIRIDIHM